jgi:CheY-like chemotaxis protein
MKRNTILCVDDDADDLQLLHESLKGANEDYIVLEAHNGRQALDILYRLKISDNAPCLIILDINMPVLNGKETLSIIKKDEALKSIPIVVFTTSGSYLDQQFCHLYGVEMITKPPNFHNFKSIVQKLLKFCSA